MEELYRIFTWLVLAAAILLAKLLEQGNRINGIEMADSNSPDKPENLTDMLIEALLV